MRQRRRRYLVRREALIRLAERDMRQSDLARAIGVDPSTVSGWFTGDHWVTDTWKRALLEALGGDEATLFAWRDRAPA